MENESSKKKTVYASQNGVRIFKSNLIRTDFVIEIPVFGFWNQEKKNENDITKTTACNVNSDDQYTMMKEEKASWNAKVVLLVGHICSVLGNVELWPKEFQPLVVKHAYYSAWISIYNFPNTISDRINMCANVNLRLSNGALEICVSSFGIEYALLVRMDRCSCLHPLNSIDSTSMFTYMLSGEKEIYIHWNAHRRILLNKIDLSHRRNAQ